MNREIQPIQVAEDTKTRRFAVRRAGSGESEPRTWLAFCYCCGKEARISIHRGLSHLA